MGDWRAPRRVSYSNPDLPEGINVGSEHPLKEFAWLASGVMLAAALLIAALGWLGHFAANLVPFETERRWAAPIAEHFSRDIDPVRQDYLRALAHRLLEADPLPEGMSIQVHYSDSGQVNAFATLGGHVIITHGLLEAMPNENALAMVLAHEIAHIRQRHVIRAIGRGVLVSLALTVLTGGTGADAVGGLLGQAGFTAALSYSRANEREADALALRNLYALYGHVGGAEAVFETLAQHGRSAPPEWLSTHPDNRARIEAIRTIAAQNGWPTEGPVTRKAGLIRTP